MRFEHVIRLLAIAPIVHSSCSVATTPTTAALAVTRSPMAVPNPSKTNASGSSADASHRMPVSSYDLAPDTAAGLDPAAASGVSAFFSCLVKRWHSGDGQWNKCYGAFSSFWNSAGDTRDDDGIGERKKDWNEQTLMIGAGFKLILLIPFLAILAGKSVLLSLISLLITSLAFLHKSHHDLFH